MAFDLPLLPQIEPTWPQMQAWWQQIVMKLEAQIESQDATIAALQLTIRNDARTSSYTLPTDVLTSTDLGGAVGASISVAAHKRIYNQTVPSVDLAAAVLPGPFPYATDHYVYYDDETLADTTPLFKATVQSTVSQPGYAVGRHYVGKVTTPAAGSPPTTGDGPAPPGGGSGDKFPPEEIEV